MAKKIKSNMVTVEEKLRALYKLQLIDTEVDKIRIVRGELPLEIEDLEDVIAGLETRLEKFDTELREINENIFASKNKITVSSEAIEKYEIQLKNIKNNREYTSLTKEVEYQNLEIQLAEKKIKQNEANILHKQEVVNACKEQVEDRKKELKLKQEELDEIVAETEKEEKILISDSQKAEKIIPQRLLDSYKRIRSRVNNGLAVVSVERGACSGYEIPPQMLIEIQTHKKVVTCEHCGRIMVDANSLEKQEA